MSFVWQGNLNEYARVQDIFVHALGMAGLNVSYYVPRCIFANINERGELNMTLSYGI